MKAVLTACLVLVLFAAPAAADLALTNPTLVATASSRWPFGLAVSGDILYVAYVNSDEEVHVRTYDAMGEQGSSFPDPEMPAGVDARWNPALAVVGTTLHLVFNSGDISDSKDRAFYHATYDLAGGRNGTWSTVRVVSGTSVYAQSDKAPALAVAGSQLWLVGKNNRKHAISQAWFAGSSWSTLDAKTCWPAGGGREAWGTVTQDFPPAAGCTDTLYVKNQIYSANPGLPRTPQAPSLTYDGSRLLLAYKGGVDVKDSKESGFYLVPGDLTGSGWDKPQRVGCFRSLLAPAIFSIGSKIGVLFSNHDDSDRLAFSTFLGYSWSEPVRVADAPATPSSKAPAPTVMPFESARKVAYSIYRDGKAELYFADYSQ